MTLDCRSQLVTASSSCAGAAGGSAETEEPERAGPGKFSRIEQVLSARNRRGQADKRQLMGFHPVGLQVPCLPLYDVIRSLPPLAFRLLLIFMGP